MFCTFWGGLMSGLTVGLLSIDELELELKQFTGTEVEKKRASKVKPVLAMHHWLLVTLLLCNAVALETMPIFLDRVVPSHIAILICVTAVLIGGEVVPQAICIGPQQLAIAECTAPLVVCLCYITAPVSWPIAKLLDKMLGEHKLTRFSSTQLEALVQMHCADVMNQCI
jgi:CBS domain containing-hemolysin-like protein